MELTWLDPDHLADRDVAGAVAVLAAADALDWPHEPARTVSTFVSDLRPGWDGDPAQTALIRDGRGRVTGVLEVTLPPWDNLHLGYLAVTVDPCRRRQGIGRRLFEAGLDGVREAGRTLVVAESLDRPDRVAFAKAMGLDRASEEVERAQDLVGLDRDRLEAVRAAAERRAAGYEMLRLPGPTPEEMLADVVSMTGAINDAPTDDLDIEDEVYSPERIRAFESAQAARGRRIYRVVARKRESGALAGHTQVGVEGETPGFAWQLDTSVVRAHRGHRLGLLLKIAMVQWLEEAEPQLRTILTWNAASNEHMIEVNEVLGYRVVANGASWQRTV